MTTNNINCQLLFQPSLLLMFVKLALHNGIWNIIPMIHILYHFMKKTSYFEVIAFLFFYSVYSCRVGKDTLYINVTKPYILNGTFFL